MNWTWFTYPELGSLFVVAGFKGRSTEIRYIQLNLIAYHFRSSLTLRSRDRVRCLTDLLKKKQFRIDALLLRKGTYIHRSRSSNRINTDTNRIAFSEPKRELCEKHAIKPSDIEKHRTWWKKKRYSENDHHYSMYGLKSSLDTRRKLLILVTTISVTTAADVDGKLVGRRRRFRFADRSTAAGRVPSRRRMIRGRRRRLVDRKPPPSVFDWPKLWNRSESRARSVALIARSGSSPGSLLEWDLSKGVLLEASPHWLPTPSGSSSRKDWFFLFVRTCWFHHIVLCTETRTTPNSVQDPPVRNPSSKAPDWFISYRAAKIYGSRLVPDPSSTDQKLYLFSVKKI